MKMRWIGIAGLAVAGLGLAAAAAAQAAPGQQAQAQSTPKGWSWQLDKDGRRVPKGNRITNPDGSWREEIRIGKCVTVKEKTAAGEFKQSSSCG